MHLLINGEPCRPSEGSVAVVVDALTGAVVARLPDNFYQIVVRRLPSGLWLLSAEEDDDTRLFRITEEGALQRLFDHAGFDVGQAIHLSLLGVIDERLSRSPQHARDVPRHHPFARTLAHPPAHLLKMRTPRSAARGPNLGSRVKL